MDIQTDSISDVVRQRPDTGLSAGQALAKRTFDLVMSLLGLVVFGWIILLAYLLATIDTRQSGFFRQERVGRNGRLFHVIKIRTMRSAGYPHTNVTTASDPRITRLGRFLRKYKIDELPQLFNVLMGQMSFVGPRPDVPGFADRLQGEERIILSVRPGITGPATLAFRHEESLLVQVDDPEQYNRDVIYPEKVRLNQAYVTNYAFFKDLKYIWQTILPQS